MDRIAKTEKPRGRTLGNWVSEFLGGCFWLFGEETVNLTVFSHSTNFIVEVNVFSSQVREYLTGKMLTKATKGNK